MAEGVGLSLAVLGICPLAPKQTAFSSHSPFPGTLRVPAMAEGVGLSLAVLGICPLAPKQTAFSSHSPFPGTLRVPAMAEGVGLSLAVLGICPLRSQANCVLIPLPIPWHAARASNGGGSGIIPRRARDLSAALPSKLRSHPTPPFPGTLRVPAMAEGVGFEPTVRLLPHRIFESGALNRAQPSLRICLLVDGECGEVFPRSKQADN